MRLFAGWSLVLGLLLASLIVPAAKGAPITIAAAADLRNAMGQLVANYRQQHPQAAITVIYGASGQLLTQIEQGAPFDLFFAADSGYPQQLIDSGQAGGTLVPYALGHLVLWSASVDMRKVRVADLAQPRFGRIALANPQHAPYGQRAEQALRAAGVWDGLQPRLVFGENVGQTAQFAQSGNATVGLLSLSQALDPALAGGSYVRVPEASYTPLRQSFVLTRRGADKPLARNFAAWMQTAAARAILQRCGFDLPTGGG